MDFYVSIMSKYGLASRSVLFEEVENQWYWCRIPYLDNNNFQPSKIKLILATFRNGDREPVIMTKAYSK